MLFDRYKMLLFYWHNLKTFRKNIFCKKDSEINSSTLVTRFTNGPAAVGLDLIMRMCTTPVRLKHLRYSDDFAYFTENHTGSWYGPEHL